jgi:hypothetical protein
VNKKDLAVWVRPKLTTGPDTFGSVALASLSLSMLMLDTSIANAGLPPLARALTASFQEVQWIVLAYLRIPVMVISGSRRS